MPRYTCLPSNKSCLQWLKLKDNSVQIWHCSTLKGNDQSCRATRRRSDFITLYSSHHTNLHVLLLNHIRVHPADVSDHRNICFCGKWKWWFGYKNNLLTLLWWHAVFNMFSQEKCSLCILTCFTMLRFVFKKRAFGTLSRSLFDHYL